MVSDIEQKVLVLGKEKMLHELVNILMDNAVKYCDDGGEIKVDLSSRKNKAQIVVSNTFEKPTDCSR